MAEDKRRNSILKPQKARNPLGDIDTRDEEGDMTNARARRVSFASSNQIKQFTTDEQKNTIWDLTYEESVDGSDNSPFSLNLQHSSKSIINKENIGITSTMLVSVDNLESVGCSTFNLNSTNNKNVIKDKFMKMTEHNQIVTRSMTQVSRSRTIKATEQQIVCRNTTEEFVVMDEFGETTMEFTQVLSPNEIDKNKTIVNDDVDMELTSVMTNTNESDERIDKNKTILYDDDVDFTSVVNINTNRNDEKNHNKTILYSDDINIDFTAAINTNINTNYCNDDPNMEFTSVVNTNINTKRSSGKTNVETTLCNQDTDMEFTSVINENIQDKNDTLDNCSDTLHKTTPYSDDPNMEFTCVTNTNSNSKSSGKKTNAETILCSQDMDMEITSVINENIQDQNDILDNITINEKEISSKEVINQDVNAGEADLVALELSSRNMDFTCAINNNNSEISIIENNHQSIATAISIEESPQIEEVLVNQQPGSKAYHNQQNGTSKGQGDKSKISVISIGDTHSINEHNERDEGSDDSKNGDTFTAMLPERRSTNEESLTALLRFGLENITSNDDTQHLINHKLCGNIETKSELSRVVAGDFNPSFSKLQQMPLGEFNTNSFHVSLNDVSERRGNISHIPSIPAIDITLDDIIQQKHNDTKRDDNISGQNNSFLCNTQPPENLHELTNSINESSDLSLVSENSSNSYFDVPTIILSWHNSLKTKPIEFIKFKYSTKEMQDKINSLITRRCKRLIKQCQILRNETNSCDDTQNTESSDGNNPGDNSNIVSMDDEAEGNIIVKIRDLEESNKKYWQLLSIDNLIYKFATLFHSVILTVKLEEDSDIVESVQIDKKIKDGAQLVAKYVNNLFCNKLSPKHIKAALGDKYDIRSLLDLVRETVHKLIEFLEEYDKLFDTYYMRMHDGFRIKFSVIKVNLMICWHFTINMLELDCISDKTVEYNAQIGTLRATDVKRCIEVCPTGTSFVKAFAENIYNLVHRMENHHTG